MKVEIKVRMLTAGNRSLYLEYYETGFRKRENLHLYLVPDDAPNARKLNEQTYRKAQEIQAQTGADIFRIETATPYPENYNATVDQGRAELRENARPALKVAKVENLAEYDTVFIGVPNWWSSIPMAVATFLDRRAVRDARRRRSRQLRPRPSAALPRREIHRSPLRRRQLRARR